MMNNIVKINGIYDIACALSILRVINVPPLANLHVGMLKPHIDQSVLFKRFFAYWIFTYGIVRVFGGGQLVTYSYFIEAICFANEYCNGTLHGDKAAFVIISSLIMCYTFKYGD